MTPAEIDEAVARAREHRQCDGVESCPCASCVIPRALIATTTLLNELRAASGLIKWSDDTRWRVTAAAERDAAIARADAAERELERWRHGVTIEGDFVCPDSLRAERAEAALAEHLGASSLLDTMSDVAARAAVIKEQVAQDERARVVEEIAAELERTDEHGRRRSSDTIAAVCREEAAHIRATWGKGQG